MGLPHVVTVDPTGALARIVRAAVELSGRSVIQIDVPRGSDALAEIQPSGVDLLVTALQLDEQSRGGSAMHGIELAVSVKAKYPGAAVVVVGTADDPDELDPEYRATAPFVYLHRPLDGAHFLRVLAAALDGADVLTISQPTSRRVEPVTHLGAIPALDMKVAARVVDSLLIDVGAMAIVVANRGGEVLLERGAVGYLDRELLTSALLPAIPTTIAMGQLVGGQPAALHFYDGDRYDVFVLSIGFHHFMCLVFDGQIGSRQFGAVNRFGRRAAEDLIALLGTSAFALAPPETPLYEPPPQAPVEPLITRAEEWTAVAKSEPLPEPEPLHLEPIANFDQSLFDDLALESVDESLADDLFDPEKLAEIANETRRERGPLTYDEARELGIIP